MSGDDCEHLIHRCGDCHRLYNQTHDGPTCPACGGECMREDPEPLL